MFRPKKNLFTAMLWLLTSNILFMTNTVQSKEALPWENQPKGHYTYNDWAGGELDVQYNVPLQSNADSKILVVIPGARRNADQYRDHWQALSDQHNFIVLAIGCSHDVCPTEYDYNLGGVIDKKGQAQEEKTQLFSAPEQIFADFVKRFGSNQKEFALYGHSAGGGFVHLYMLMRPDAPVSRAVSANAAFFSMPVLKKDFPFGLKGAGVKNQQINQWLLQPLTFMLADLDTGPRTKTLSNSDLAKQQGLSVFARGLSFYATAINRASALTLKTNWKLEIVHDVGHNSKKMTPHALKYLFPEMKGNNQ